MTRKLVAQLPFIVLLVVAFTFSLLTPKFATTANAANLLTQASSAAVLAGGMSFVLLASCIDLSVGSQMFFAAAVAGKLLLAYESVPLAIVAMPLVGVCCGAVHGLLVTWAGLAPFIATMASLFVLRGAGLWLTETRAMNLPAEFTGYADATVAGFPLPIVIACVTLLALTYLHRRTAFGRQIVAIGHDREEAYKAGINCSRTIWQVYLVSGVCCAIAGFISLTQLGTVSPSFGRDREFNAIAAAVLGGTSLSGGTGSILPGAAIGAILVTMVFNGLNLIDANPYTYPLITGTVILFAILCDAVRHRHFATR
ncbi:MAG: ABC transporter permease [Planctomycetales bacterium]|nr:ABC transporter permease [Planctomycetales bacterium]MCA9168831.1 ABC transporter permease [Planctomycetales bacterium]